MEAARGSKGPIDQLVRDSVVQGIKEADVFTGMRDLGSNAFERSRRAGEIGAVIDYRNMTGGRLMIPDPVLSEKMHTITPDGVISQIQPVVARPRRPPIKDCGTSAGAR